MSVRIDGRSPAALRPVQFQANFQVAPAGAVLVSFGGTRVLCAVSVDKGVPSWMKAQGATGGWLTAEYRMLPGATSPRQGRKENGRSTEIQRLVGRSLRAVVDLEKLSELTVTVDCDVLDADGGTRCAAITGASVALELAFQKLLREGRIAQNPLRSQVAAVSVGIVAGQPLLDLSYPEDSAAEVDMNVVMTAEDRLVEVQGTGEEATFSRRQMGEMLDLAEAGMRELFAAQRRALQACGCAGAGL